MALRSVPRHANRRCDPLLRSDHRISRTFPLQVDMRLVLVDADFRAAFEVGAWQSCRVCERGINAEVLSGKEVMATRERGAKAEPCIVVQDHTLVPHRTDVGVPLRKKRLGIRDPYSSDLSLLCNPASPSLSRRSNHVISHSKHF